MLAPKNTTRARESSRREKAPCDGRRPGLLQAGSLHGSQPMQAWLSDPILEKRWLENQPEMEARRRQGRQRLVRIESWWTKTPLQVGRARRSELGVVKHRVPRTRWCKGRKALSRRGSSGRSTMIETRSLREWSSTGARVFSSVWMAVVGGAHLACAKGRETRADASSTRNSRRSTPQSKDRKAKGCDASAAVSSTG